MRSVYIIDEEYHFAENVASRLRFEGIQAIVFYDATEALEYFIDRHAGLDVISTRILVDVSLAPGDDLELFGRQETDDFLQTGIVLVNELMRRCPGLCQSSNTILYTAHYQTVLWDRIDEFCRKHKFRNWQKAPNSDADDILRLVEVD